MDVPEGWRISSDINGSVPYVVTNSSETFPQCPEGLTGGFVPTQDGTLHYDSTFRIECHSEEVIDNCGDCEIIEVMVVVVDIVSLTLLLFYNRLFMTLFIFLRKSAIHMVRVQIAIYDSFI